MCRKETDTDILHTVLCREGASQPTLDDTKRNMQTQVTASHHADGGRQNRQRQQLAGESRKNDGSKYVQRAEHDRVHKSLKVMQVVLANTLADEDAVMVHFLDADVAKLKTWQVRREPTSIRMVLTGQCSHSLDVSIWQDEQCLISNGAVFSTSTAAFAGRANTARP
jgi:hypothetical protein